LVFVASAVAWLMCENHHAWPQSGSDGSVVEDLVAAPCGFNVQRFWSYLNQGGGGLLHWPSQNGWLWWEFGF